MKTKKDRPPFVNFSMVREYLGRDGLWNPRDRMPPLKAAFQINVFGSREHYLQLAEFFRAFAERDTSTDGDYHEHFEGLMSTDGNVRLHIILRKDDVGDSIWGEHFPKPTKKNRRAKPNDPATEPSAATNGITAALQLPRLVATVAELGWVGGSRVMQTQSEKQEWEGVIRWRPHQPIFGRLSLWVLAAAAAVTVVSFLIPMLGSFGESGMAFIVVGLWAGGIMCIANLVIASIGLARRESPRWPAITGLLLSVLPALGGVYLFCGAPW